MGIVTSSNAPKPHVNLANPNENPLDEFSRIGCISFDLKPGKKPFLSVSPNWDLTFLRQSAEIILQKSAIGATAGTVGGGALAIVEKLTGMTPLYRKIKDYLTAGFFIGGFIGGVQAVVESYRVYLNRTAVIHKTQEAADKAKNIISAFIESQLANAYFSIQCPIRLEVMVFPVDLNCGAEGPPHTVDYHSFLEWYYSQPSSSKKVCPLCTNRDGEVNINKITRNKEKEATIHAIAANIFKSMEAILNRLPKRSYGNDMPTFSDKNSIEALTEKVKQGKSFLEGDIEQIKQKIAQPDQLTEAEAFALAYYLVHQFEPLADTLKQVHRTATHRLNELYENDQIQRETKDTQIKLLDDWYEKFNLIPEECKTIRQLCKLKGGT